jgi:hypothetical protein
MNCQEITRGSTVLLREENEAPAITEPSSGTAFFGGSARRGRQSHSAVSVSVHIHVVILHINENCVRLHDSTALVIRVRAVLAFGCHAGPLRAALAEGLGHRVEQQRREA